MWFFVRKSDGTVAGNSGVTEVEGRLGHPDRQVALDNFRQESGLAPDEVLPFAVLESERAWRLLAPDPASLLVTLDQDQVLDIAPDPGWSPPEPPADPVRALGEEVRALQQAVARNILASPHDRRWSVQKEAAKGVMDWIKDNPQCEQAEVEALVLAAMSQAQPGQPLVVNPAGLIESYAVEAAARGYTAQAGFPALRDLIVASSDQDLRLMLAQF